MALVAPTRVTGVVSVESAPLACVTGFQPDEVSGASSVGVEFVPRKEQEAIPMPVLGPRNGCTSPDPATWIEQKLQKVFDDPAQRLHNRHHETDRKGPGEAPCIDSQPKPGQAQAKPSSLQDVNAEPCRTPGHAKDGLESFGDHGGVELLWHKYFQHPSDWWDSRNNKTLGIEGPRMRFG